MKSLFTFLFTLAFVCVLFPQDNLRDGKPINVDPNAPYFVSTPGIESTNQINESFENVTFPPSGWSKINVAGGTGWERITAGTTPIPGWNGGTVTVPPVTGAGTAVAWMNYNLGGTTVNDNWLVTSQLMTVGPGDTLAFWMRKFGDCADAVDVKISTTVNNNPAAFTITVQNIVFAVADSGWVRRSYPIGNLVPPGSNIYIGFREHVLDNGADGAAIFIDMLSAGGPFVPVEFVSFTGSAAPGSVNLNWSTATETNNRGFEVQRNAGAGYTTVGFVQGNGTTTKTQSYSFTDRNLSAGSYTYRLKQLDFNGISEYSSTVEVIVNPSEFALNQNYPNPFNPSTSISFSLAVDSKINLRVFNILGQEVSTLVNSTLPAGLHNVNFDASGLNSGIYFYKIEASGLDGSSFSSVKKMTLTK